MHMPPIVFVWWTYFLFDENTSILKKIGEKKIDSHCFNNKTLSIDPAELSSPFIKCQVLKSFFFLFLNYYVSDY